MGTGFTEQQLKDLSTSLSDHIIPKPKGYYQVSDEVKPDVWFEPVFVWEILAADLSLSPVHRAAEGLVDNKKGIALRFPRFLKIRDDKKPTDATGAEQIFYMYINQFRNKK